MRHCAFIPYPSADLLSQGLDDCRFTVERILPADGVEAVIEALRESLDAMERMDARLLAYSNGAAEGDKGEITRARAALQAIGAI